MHVILSNFRALIQIQFSQRNECVSGFYIKVSETDTFRLFLIFLLPSRCEVPFQVPLEVNVIRIGLRGFCATGNVITYIERADFVTSDWSEVIVGETSERNSGLKTQCVRELDSGSVGGSDLQPPFSSVGFSEAVEPSVGKVGIASGPS
ncbi:hypothetical protein Tco_0513234, partial [Tanacetum coccineum]